jgi:hypothetical protein
LGTSTVGAGDTMSDEGWLLFLVCLIVAMILYLMWRSFA